MRHGAPAPPAAECAPSRGRGDAGTGSERGSTKPGKFVAQQPLRIEDLDGALAFGAFDHAVHEIRIDGARAGVIRLDPIGRKAASLSIRSTTKPTGAPRLDARSPASPSSQRRVGQAQQAAQARRPAVPRRGDWQGRARLRGASGMWARRGTRTISATSVKPEAKRRRPRSGTRPNATSAAPRSTHRRRRLAGRRSGASAV